MRNQPDLLSHVRIASPCPALWSEMTGDDRRRFCKLCSKHVYNIVEMTRDEASAWLAEQVESPCVRIYRRNDGTVLTADCPVGLRRIRHGLARAVGAIAILAFVVLDAFALVAANGTTRQRAIRARQFEPFNTVAKWLNPPVFRGQMVMGSLRAPSTAMLGRVSAGAYPATPADPNGN